MASKFTLPSAASVACARFVGWLRDVFYPPTDVHHAAYALAKEQNKLLFKSLRIEEPFMRDFFDSFRFVDADNSGSIEYEEFLDFFGLQDTKFIERFYKDGDADKSGGLDFAEFIIATYDLCSRSDESVTRFVFDIFDTDGNGSLTTHEVVAMVKLMFPEGELDQSVSASLLRQLDVNGDGVVTYDEVVTFFNIRKDVMRPVHMLKRKLHHSVCGPEFWSTMADWRALKFGEHSTMDDIIGEQNKLRLAIKAAQLDESKAALEEVQIKLQEAAKERAQKVLGDSRKLTRLEYVKLAIALTEQWFYQLRAQSSINDIEKTQFVRKAGQALARVEELHREINRVWDRQFDTLFDNEVAHAEVSSHAFLDSPIGLKVVARAATELVQKSLVEKTTAGKRLDQVRAEKLVREKLQDTMVTMAQEQLQADKETMLKLRQEDLDLMRRQVHGLQIPPLEKIMEGSVRFIALITDFSEKEVKEIKAMDGGWFENLLMTRALESAPKEKGAISHKNDGRFVSAESGSYIRENLQLSCEQFPFPMCPQCNEAASKNDAKFCRFCRTPLWTRKYDPNEQCVYYTKVLTEEVTVKSPFTEEFELKMTDEARPDRGGRETLDPDERYVGMSELRISEI